MKTLQQKMDDVKQANGIVVFAISFDDLVKNFTLTEIKKLNSLGLIDDFCHKKAKMLKGE